jgi:PAS domain S-box-containing protein
VTSPRSPALGHGGPPQAEPPGAQTPERTLLEHGLAGVYRSTVGGRLLYCNPAFARVFGYSRDELLALPMQELYLDVADRDGVLARLRAEGLVVADEVRMRRRDGEPAWVLFSERLHRTADGEEVIEGTLIDVSARRAAEAALRESQHRMVQALRAARAGAWEWDLGTNRATWSDENYELLGYAPGSVAPSYEAWHARLHPDDRAGASAAVEDAMARRGNLDIQFRVVMPDGGVRWLRDVGRIMLDAAGRPTGMFGIQIDVTEKAQSAEALRLAEQRLQSLLRELPVVLFVLDRNGAFTLSEGRALATLGLRPGQVVGRSALEVYRDFPAVVAQLRRALAGEVTRATLEVGRLTFDTAFTPLRDAGGRLDGVIGVALDVTERRRVEEEQRQDQRLESVGVLAGGLAHDFNNLLTSILASMSLAKEASSDAERRELLADAERASSRARDLTRQLLTFSRGGAPVRRLLELPRVLRETLGFAMAGTPVVGEAVIDPDLWPVEADEGQLAQALNNLLINAAQAMPQGGRVVVRASNRPASANGEAGPRVAISVEDQGVGIPAEHLPRVFDPYFTTKQAGSGLGLAVVHSVVRAHGGRIGVTSEPGRGSSFTLELPASPGGEVAARPAERPPARRGGRILVMDDEPLVRKAAERALGRLGYEVVAVADGAEAVARYEAARLGGSPFQAVILDLTVPGGMGGAEAMARLRQVHPDVKAIVSSGYASNSVMADHDLHGFSDVLEKPWRVEELGAVLDRVLGS